MSTQRVGPPRATRAVALRRVWLVAFALVLLAAGLSGVVVGVNAGAAPIPASQVVSTIVSAFGVGDKPDILTYHIVVDMRLPRVVASLLTGCGLAVAGCVLQSLTGNALADPYVLGISGGAMLGAVAILASGVSFASVGGFSAVTIAAFVGAMLALIVVFALSITRSGVLAGTRMILAGVAVGQLTGAGAAAMIFFGDRDAARRVQDWTMGSLAGARWSSLPVTAAVVAVLCVLVLSQARYLDAFVFGEQAAASLGVNVAALRWALYGSVSLATAALVAQAGLIGFVGLVVPHVVRMLIGPLHTRLLPFTMASGAVLMVWTDIVCRSIVPQQELPLGLATAIIGVPVFIYVLSRQKGI